MPNQVRVGVGVTGARQASSEVDKFRDKFAALQKQGAKGLAIGAGIAAANLAFRAAGQVIGTVINTIDDATQAFIEDEASQRLLRTSLKANVAAWDGNTQAIEDVIRARMALGFTDEEQRDSLARLVAATHDVNEALHVEAVAMDLARFKGISLGEASDALTRVEAGSYRILKSLGIVLKDGATQTDALAAVEKVAAGQAEDFAGSLEGRLTVAAVKNKESLEALGQTTAELSVDFEEAKAKAVGQFATGLDFLTDSINMNSQSYERQLELQAENIQMSFTMTQAEKDQAIAVLQLAMNNYEAHKAFVDVGDSGNRFVKTLKDGKPAAAGLTRDMKDLEQEAKDLDGVISDLSDTIEYDLFGKAIAKGREAELQLQLKDLRKEYDKTESSFRRKIVSGEIAQVKEELFKLHLEEAAKAGPQAAIDFLKKEEKHAGAAKDEIRALILKYQALAALQGDLGPIIVVGGAPHGPAKKRAGGGPVAAHEAYTVGEQGEETLVMGNQSGTIIPHGSGGGPGMTIVNHFNISGVSVLTPGSAEALARQLEPVITRAQQRRGQLAGARAF